MLTACFADCHWKCIDTYACFPFNSTFLRWNQCCFVPIFKDLLGNAGNIHVHRLFKALEIHWDAQRSKYNSLAGTITFLVVVQHEMKKFFFLVIWPLSAPCCSETHMQEVLHWEVEIRGRKFIFWQTRGSGSETYCIRVRFVFHYNLWHTSQSTRGAASCFENGRPIFIVVQEKANCWASGLFSIPRVQSKLPLEKTNTKHRAWHFSTSRCSAEPL